METYGARVVASPSTQTQAGRKILAQHPNSNGSLGIAISKAVEVAAADEQTKYALGSVLNHVLLHQTVIGQEALTQLEMAGDYPDIVIGCTGGGSNFAGIAFPFIGAKLRGERDIQVIAVEPAACPSLTRGKYAYDFGDTAHLTPLTKMHTLGSSFVPEGIHAGGLRYHGMAPLVSHIVNLGLVESRAESQLAYFAAGLTFAHAEGILPAPEANHAVKATIDQALLCKQEGRSKTILFNLCGHGHFDLRPFIMNPISSPKSPKILLLLADVDGTLVTKEKILTDRARAAVHKLWDAGIRFAITSGRPPLGMKMIVDALKLTEPTAAFNGGLFLYPDFSTLEENVLPTTIAQDVVKMIAAHHLDVWIYRGKDWFVHERHGLHVDREEWTVKFSPTVVSSFDGLFDSVVKIVGVSDDLDAVAKCKTVVQQAFSPHIQCQARASSGGGEQVSAA